MWRPEPDTHHSYKTLGMVLSTEARQEGPWGHSQPSLPNWWVLDLSGKPVSRSKVGAIKMLQELAVLLTAWVPSLEHRRIELILSQCVCAGEGGSYICMFLHTQIDPERSFPWWPSQQPVPLLDTRSPLFIHLPCGVLLSELVYSSSCLTSSPNIGIPFSTPWECYYYYYYFTSAYWLLH